MSKKTRNRFVALGGLLLLACGIALAVHFFSKSEAVATGPIPKRTDAGYATSNSCVSCHPGQHSSWHASYHRTMTQVASPQTVVAPFNDQELKAEGGGLTQTATLSRQGDKFFVNTADQAWENEKFAEWAQSKSNGGEDPFSTGGEAPRVDAEVVMTTGSHHFQAYWIKGEEGRELWQFPWRYHIAEKRWVHRKDVFLAPPEWRPGMWFRVWNKQCIYCHSTGPYPGKDLETEVMTDTQVAEFGISCEACHGPAEDHVAFHNDGPTDDAKTDPIVNPAKLDHTKSSQICGSCHSHFTHSDPGLSVHGPRFRPGDNLMHFGSLETPPKTPVVMSRFWGDGANRSGGREYSGMSTSECFRQGDLSCVSCHSMHEGDPNDQLSVSGANSEACLQCHEQFRDADSLTAHTHHDVKSSGSECYNCHMPHTNYALYKAIRSHRIDIPKVSTLKSNSRPNACNLCHLDQTQQWTANYLDEWYSIKSPELSFDDKYVSAGVLWALKGDAGQRVIAAWHFGWNPARQASGSDWMTPFIAELMKDPYAAVRWVAFDALRKDSDFSETKFDFDGTESDRITVAELVVSQWAKNRATDESSSQRWPRVLFGTDGLPDLKQIQNVLSDRDQRMVAGVE